LLRQTLFRLSQQKQLRDFATHNGIAQHMARRFVAGETIDEAVLAIREINRRGMTATLDHLGENVTSRSEAMEATQSYCRLLDEVARSGITCNCSLKLTQLGLDLGRDFARDNLRYLLDRAQELQNFVRIDMESSEYVEATLDIFYELFDRYKNVGVVIQAYLYRSERDLEQLIKSGARVRLVKGAYLEPPSVAFQQKADVDANFVHLTRMLLGDGNYPAIATHDEAMIGEAIRYARYRRRDAESFEFQMLYGIRRDLQAQLVRDGYRMRIYVPYGTAWYPYLMRRMAERPANVMFVLGNIAREGVGGRK